MAEKAAVNHSGLLVCAVGQLSRQLPAWDKLGRGLLRGRKEGKTLHIEFTPPPLEINLQGEGCWCGGMKRGMKDFFIPS